jgi:hypothetical protein
MTETDEGALTRAEREAAAEARADAEADAADAIANGEDPMADYSTAFTPRNVAVGLAIVAGLVMFAASRRRRRRREDEGD